MKKVLSFVLVLTLVLGSFSMVFAATPTDVVGADCENAVTALVDLGVVSGYEDGTYKPDQTVTRAEAAKLVIAALGMDAYASGNAASFTDLDGYQWAAGYIGYAQALGILKGDGNGKFRPGDTVTYQEFITMVVRAVGWTDAALPGTWPANYVAKAQALGILKNVGKVGNAAATRGDVAVVLYNNLNNPIGYINNENQWVRAAGTAVGGEDTMLSRLEKRTANAGAAFVVTGSALNNTADGVNIREYLGAKVVAYTNTDGEITGIKECKTKFLTGNFNKDGKFVVGDTKYAVANAISATPVPAFVNGGASGAAVATNAISTDTDTDYTLACVISGTTIKEIVSVAIWQPVYMKANATTVKNISKDNQISKNYTFATDKNQAIDTTSFVLVGAKSVADIAKDNILTVYANGTTITKLCVSDATVTGKVTKISSDNKKVTVNGTAYKYIATKGNTTVVGATGVWPGTIKAGSEYKLTLSQEGYVYEFDKVSGELNNYALVNGLQLGNNKSFGAAAVEPKVKLVLADGTKKEIALDTDELEDLGLITAAAVTGNYSAQASMAGIQEGSLVSYELNSKGEICNMAVAEQSAGFVKGTTQKVSAKGVLNGYTATKDTVVFEADNVFQATDSAIGHQGTGKWEALADSDITSYIMLVDKDNDSINAIVVQADSTTSNKIYGVVNSVYTTDTDAGYGVDMLIDGQAVTKESDKMLPGVVTSQALMLIKYNTDGTVNKTQTDYIKNTAESTKEVVYSSGAAVGGSTDAGYITVENGNLKTAADIDATKTNRGALADTVVVCIYDADNDWTVGDVNDLNDLELKTAADNVTVYKLDKDDANLITHVLVYIGIE